MSNDLIRILVSFLYFDDILLAEDDYRVVADAKLVLNELESK